MALMTLMLVGEHGRAHHVATVSEYEEDEPDYLLEQGWADAKELLDDVRKVYWQHNVKKEIATANKKEGK